MANKYAAQSRQAQAKQRRDRACSYKRRYATKEAAEKNGQEVYACGFCQGFHCSGALLRVAKQGGRWLKNRGM